MSQISEYLQYQIQLRDIMQPICSENQNQEKKKKNKKNKPLKKCIIPKKTQDRKYQFYTKPSEFPSDKDRDIWRTIKYKSLFSNLGKNEYFL